MSCFLAVMRFPYESCRVLLHTFLMRYLDEMSCFLAVMRCPCEILCVVCAQFSCEISWWDVMLFWVVTSFAYEISCLFGRYAMSWWDSMLCGGCRIFFLMVWCKGGGEVYVEGCGRLSVHDVLLDVAWFCMCKLGGSLAGEMNVSWVVVVRCKCECVGRQKGLCGSCLIRATSMHHIKSIRMFEDDVTWPEHALVMQGGSLGGLGWWSDVCIIWRMFAFFGLFEYFDQGSSANFSCALTVNVICLLFLQQCFERLLNSTETSVSGTSRKLPICLVVSQYAYLRLTWRDVNSWFCDWRVQSEVWGWWWWCAVKMVERWCWRMREIECTPIAHCNNSCGLWLTVIFSWDWFPDEISCLLALVPNTFVSK
jgi:hypothetical protein